MSININKVLVVNAGGGIGDAVQFLKIFKLINLEFNNPQIYYYSCDSENFWFETSLQSLKPKNLFTIKHFPKHFGFRKNHIFMKFDKKIDYYDIIIDNQSKLRNTLIYKRIPHKYFFSFTCRGIFSKPITFNKKIKHVQLRVVKFLEKFLKKKISLEKMNIPIEEKFETEANKLIDKTKKYIGFSLKAGHPTRIKEFNADEIIKTAIYFYDKNYIPAFFIEEKHTELIKQIKERISNAFFPEHLANINLKNPSLLIALGKKMNFNISIDNGAMHLLALSEKKLFCFFNENSEKFKPLSNDAHIYDCKLKNQKINELNSEQIIQFINENLA